MAKVGIIGGSGLDDKLNLTQIKRRKLHTPYGATSDLIITGKLQGLDVVALPRHGADHRIMPSLVNYRANIWAMKELGVTHIIATTACGSLREEIKPGHLVFIDQFIDRTTRRAVTFYQGMEVCHIPMAEPFCPQLRRLFSGVAAELNIPHHDQGTVVTIEGPRFSTKAESKMFQMWGGDVINMSTVPEVVLAREAGLCYAAIAMSTDYDCWHESKESVTFELILKTMAANAANVHRMFPEVIRKITDWPCDCRKGCNINSL
ncbi:MAG: S-methyl-5'-thioadenosine phosphorylase [Verrucomicrobia bacterium]|nr:S-methyl-5'-thioadenosine phosphorylase [Verrucomicrobiota bacterium]MBU4291216.1 S-methyl-5'-thioadenosine phosphorylase [Verrucomicrobiota bacterium]MBU4429274.1 S-methyl-5'-thioadenosine phosphorylase [Verrucomicrobiota bacterium]MCG2678617.1 S-methyl-5'-thioadenosine phosphorylase [Kiritimatiellia bacterium]